MRFGNQNVKIEKQWRLGSISSWIAKYGNKTVDLTVPSESKQWQMWFLKQVGNRPVRLPSKDLQIEERYTNCIHLIFDTGAALLQRCGQPDFILANSGFEAEVTTGHGLKRLYMSSAARSDQLKLEQRRGEDEEVARAADAADLKAVETDLTDVQSLIGRIDERVQRVQLDRTQWSRVQKYLDSKHDELKVLNAEIDVYASALRENGVVDVSSEEFRDLERKSRQYEQITKSVTALQERLIEQRHLQKNIEGLQKEMDDLRSQPMNAKTQKQIRIYEGEVKRMSRIIANLHNLDGEIAAKELERDPLLASHRKFMVLSKSHKLLSQNDTKKLQTILKKALHQRDTLLQEIGGLEVDTADNGLVNAISQEDSLKQQLRELQKRADDLRQILLNKTQKRMSRALEDGKALGIRLHGELSVKAYLNLATDLWQEALWQRWRDFMSERMEALAACPDSASSLFKLWQNSMGYATSPGKQPVWSDTESSLLALLLRVLWLSRSGSVLVLDDEWDWRCDPETRMTIQRMVEHQGFRQILQFTKT